MAPGTASTPARSNPLKRAPWLSGVAAVALAAGCRGDPSGIPEPVEIQLNPRDPAAVQVVSVGDILLADASQKTLDRRGWDWPFTFVDPLLGDADLLLGNLEGPITRHKKKYSKRQGYSYRARPAAAQALKRRGFHALSLANNHALDFGVQGMQDTVAALRRVEILPLGAGANEGEARQGAVFDLGGLRIGVLACSERFPLYSAIGWFAKGPSPGVAAASKASLRDDIARMKRHADFVLVTIHWGDNYEPVTRTQKDLGHLAIDLGADLVNGHHPHIAQGVELYRGKPIVYSVGNFVFGTAGRFSKGKWEVKDEQGRHVERQGYGLVARYFFSGKALRWVALTPIGVNNKRVKFRPRRVLHDEGRTELDPRMNEFGTRLRWQDDTAFVGLTPGWEADPLPTLPFPGAADLPAPAWDPAADPPQDVEPGPGERAIASSAPAAADEIGAVNDAAQGARRGTSPPPGPATGPRTGNRPAAGPPGGSPGVSP